MSFCASFVAARVSGIATKWWVSDFRRAHVAACSCVTSAAIIIVSPRYPHATFLKTFGQSATMNSLWRSGIVAKCEGRTIASNAISSPSEKQAQSLRSRLPVGGFSVWSTHFFSETRLYCVGPKAAMSTWALTILSFLGGAYVTLLMAFLIHKSIARTILILRPTLYSNA
jgi:hypothetical protein